MAYNDIKSTKERVAALRNVKKLVDQAIKSSLDAQKYFDAEMLPSNLGEWDVMWDGIQARMQLALDASLQAVAELELLNNKDGFVFQYEWQAGKRGLHLISLDSGADTIAFHVDAGDSVENTANAAVLLADDVVELSGWPGSLDGSPLVVSASGRTITCNAIGGTDTSTTASIKLTRREA